MNEIYGLYCACEACVQEPERIRYVGQTIRGAAERFKFHRYDALAENYAKKSNLAVYRWMRKHGIENIRFRVLETGLDVAELDDREVEWIAKLKTYAVDNPGGLNLAVGGASVRGYKHTEETRKKMSGREYSQGTKDKMSESAKARGMGHLAPFWGMFKGEKSANATMSDNTASKIKSDLWDGAGIKETARKYGVGDNTVNHLLQGRTWVHVPWPTDRVRTLSTAHQRSSAKRVGIPLTDTTKEKLSKSISAAWDDPDRRARGSEAVSGESNPSAKLDEGTVWYIRQEAESGRSYADIAKELGVTGGCVSKVARRLTWKHVK